MLVPFSTWNQFARLEREMDAFLHGRSNAFAPLAGNGDARKAVTWQPAVDVAEDAGRIVLTADLPGVDEKEIEISVENNVLTLRGERKVEQREGEGYRRYERVFGGFARSFTLPRTVDAEKVTAEMKAGVLTLTLPKKAEAQPRTIKVNVQ